MGFTRGSGYSKERTFKDISQDEKLEKGLKQKCICFPQDNNFWYIHDEGSITCRKCGEFVNVRTLE